MSVKSTVKLTSHGHLAVGSLLVVFKQFRELGDGSRAVLTAHTLNASTDANLDHARLDGIGNLDTCLQARAALSVQRVHAGAVRETGSQSSSTELSGTSAGRQHTTDGDVFNQRWIDVGTFNQGPECTVEKVGGGRVFETSFAPLGQGGAETCCYDNIIGALLEDGIAVWGQIGLG